ncbi:MAG: TAT-variant-translocated molybdopterin oxidoreductase [Planctomycetota bacterium]
MTSNDSASTETPSPGKHGYWRSLSEYHGREEFDQYLHREFPVGASELPDGVSRRRWLQLMGASLAMAGAAGCRYPEEVIAPFVIRPEGRIPGETYSRATNIELAGRAYNLLINCVDGRPVKIECNTDHPSGGGTDTYAQACILGLYDPDRARFDSGEVITRDEKRRIPASWADFDDAASNLMAAAGDGASMAVLMSPTQSPSVLRLLGKLKEKMPAATLCAFDGVHGDAMQTATTKLFGQPAKQVLSLKDADLIVSLQCDVLSAAGPEVSSQFSSRRDPDEGKMNRLYVVEGGYTTTGAAADARLALRPSQMKPFLDELGRRVAALQDGETHDHPEDEPAFDAIGRPERLERFLDVLAHDIVDAGDKAVIVVGDALGAEAIEAGVRMNRKLGSLGELQKFAPVAKGDVTLKDLVAKIDNGDIKNLLILGDNPVTTSPADIDMASAIAKVSAAGTSIYLGEYDDETSLICDWSLPLAHPLESWGDVVNDEGYYGVCQPQILPLLGGRTSLEVLARMLGEDEIDPQLIVRRTADSLGAGSLSNRQWRKLLHDGYDETLKEADAELTIQGDDLTPSTAPPVAATEVDKDNMEVLFQVADGLYDGRFANNGWLQELPQPLTKVCWDNAAVMSPATAAAIGLKHGLLINLRIGDAKVQLPVYEMPGCAPGVVTTTIGYGRERAGMVGGYAEKDVPVIGIDVNPIRFSDAMLLAVNVEGRPRFEEYDLATTQDHWAIDDIGRDETELRSFSLVREGSLALWEKIPDFAESKGTHVPHVGEDGSPFEEPLKIIKKESEDGGPMVPQWGMSVDLSKCTGCNACVVACQSENNIPIVGREQVKNSREMHWLRIDRYFQGDEENANVVQTPMSCSHCETAPCEQVCPVAATVHTNEGINAMAYNRCIGTRYCANNCPFKVRRFNYFNYNEDIGVGYGVKAFPGAIENANRKLQALVVNPDVTVRGRGVMEKCTYCIQRIEKGKIKARTEGRTVQDSDVVTACQSACSANAIEFGNLADPESAVSKKRKNKRSYGMLAELNVKPRTEYLARIRNTPVRLMTAAQIDDLNNLEAPHHAAHGEHGDGHGEHGDGHADGVHGEDGHDDHSGDSDSHSDEEKKTEGAAAAH